MQKIIFNVVALFKLPKQWTPKCIIHCPCVLNSVCQSLSLTSDTYLFELVWWMRDCRCLIAIFCLNLLRISLILIFLQIAQTLTSSYRRPQYWVFLFLLCWYLRSPFASLSWVWTCFDCISTVGEFRIQGCGRSPNIGHSQNPFLSS